MGQYFTTKVTKNKRHRKQQAEEITVGLNGFCIFFSKASNLFYHLSCRKQQKQQNSSWFWEFWSEEKPQQASLAQMGMQTCLRTSGQGCRTPFLNISLQRMVRIALLVGKLFRLRNTYSQMHQHCQEGQANPSVCVFFLYVLQSSHKKKDLQAIAILKLARWVFKPEE